MKTQVFAHKGWVGISSSTDAEGLLNKPMDAGQLGFVVDAAFVDISPEALELLKRVPKSSDDIGEVDIFGSNDGMIIFSWLGGIKKMFKPEHVSSSNSYNPSLISTTVPVEIDPAFIKIVETMGSDS
jgi:hypothetical protein